MKRPNLVYGIYSSRKVGLTACHADLVVLISCGKKIRSDWMVLASCGKKVRFYWIFDPTIIFNKKETFIPLDAQVGLSFPKPTK